MQQRQRNYFLVFIILLLSLLILDYGQPELFSFFNANILQSFYIGIALLAIFVYFFDSSKTYLFYSIICFVSYFALIIYARKDLFSEGVLAVALLQVAVWPIFLILEFKKWRRELKVLFWLAGAFHLVSIGIYFFQNASFDPYGYYFELYYFTTYIYIIYVVNWNDLIRRLEERYQVVKEMSEKQDIEFEKQLRAAQRIQIRTLPRGNEIKDVAIAVAYKPLWSVGGDFCSIIQPGTTFIKHAIEAQPMSHCGLIVGDVTGKGPAAAMIMSDIIARTQMMGFGRIKPAETLGLLNEQLYTLQDFTAPSYATACYLAFDIDTQVITLANAGHEPPLFYHGNDDSVEEIDVSGIMLGVTEGINDYNEKTIHYQKGDRLILYTDGIMAMNASKKTLAELILEYSNQSIQEMSASIAALMTGKGYNHTHYDDYLLLILEF